MISCYKHSSNYGIFAKILRIDVISTIKFPVCNSMYIVKHIIAVSAVYLDTVINYPCELHGLHI